MDPALFRIMICLRLRLPIASKNIDCPLCDGAPDRMGDHARACLCDGYRAKCAPSWLPEFKLVDSTVSSKKVASCPLAWTWPVPLKTVCKLLVGEAGGQLTSGLGAGERMVQPFLPGSYIWPTTRGCGCFCGNRGPGCRRLRSPQAGSLADGRHLC